MLNDTYTTNTGMDPVNPGRWHSMFHKHVSWSGIIAGTLVALGIGFLFDLLNLGIGLSAFANKGAVGIGAGSVIWLIICAIITMFIAGWVSGKLARHGCVQSTTTTTGHAKCCKGGTGVLHGFTTWSLALIVTLILASHMSSLLPFNTEVPYLNAPTATTPAASAVSVTTNSNAPTVAAGPRGEVVVNAEKAAISAFFIFLFGAIAACVGGYIGILSKHGHCRKDETPTKTTI